MKKIFNIVFALVIAFSAVSCKDYFDINYDPNIPATENITNSMIFPGVDAALATSYGDFLRITGGYFSEHYAQTFGTSNYVDYSQFTMSATRSSTHYTQLYQKVLVNSKTIMDRAKESKTYGDYLAAASIFAFTFQILVDCYGEVPYTQAFNSEYMAPVYDDGKVVYEGVIAILEEALTSAGEGQQVAKNLLYPNGNSTDWIKFANTVKLKLLSRMAGAADVQAKLDALISEDNFITSDAEYAGCWANAQGQASPYYSEEFAPWHSQDNVVANAALVAAMQFEGYTDPRLGVWFKQNSSNKYVGAISGCNLGATASAPYNSASGLCRPIINYNTPVSLISVAEVEFFKAEYYAKKGDSGAAEEHYNKAIEASFASAGLSKDDATLNIKEYPFDAANYKESIGVAKWIALSGSNNFESWCELRRLGYPAFGEIQGSDLWTGTDVNTTAVNALVPGTLYTPYQVFDQVGTNKVLQRWPYATASESRNSNCPSFPGYTTPVFWAK